MNTISALKTPAPEAPPASAGCGLTATQKVELLSAYSLYMCQAYGTSLQDMDLSRESRLYTAYTEMAAGLGLTEKEAGRLCWEISQNYHATIRADEAEGWVPFYKRVAA